MSAETQALAGPSDPVAAAAGGLTVDPAATPAPAATPEPTPAPTPAPRPDGPGGISARAAVVAVAVLLAVAVAVALFIGAGGGADEAAGHLGGRAAAPLSSADLHPASRRAGELQDRLDRLTLRNPTA